MNQLVQTNGLNPKVMDSFEDFQRTFDLVYGILQAGVLLNLRKTDKESPFNDLMSDLNLDGI